MAATIPDEFLDLMAEKFRDLRHQVALDERRIAGDHPALEQLLGRLVLVGLGGDPRISPRIGPASNRR